MPQINDIRELAQQNARYVSNSPQDWMSYLDVAARLYRYSFTDALLIHAQRPDATACAELELWNQKMSRWVNRGAKGIALLDDTGPRTKLRYVFDIADTHLVRGGKTPLLWNLDSHEHEQAILDHLADTYGLSQTDNMNTALMELAQQLTADNLDEAMDGLAYEVKGTFLEELDEDNIRVRFRELMTNSIFYSFPAVVGRSLWMCWKTMTLSVLWISTSCRCCRFSAMRFPNSAKRFFLTLAVRCGKFTKKKSRSSLKNPLTACIIPIRTLAH